MGRGRPLLADADAGMRLEEILMQRAPLYEAAADATVSTDAVVDRLLTLLVPERHELVLFDINRVAVKSMMQGDGHRPG